MLKYTQENRNFIGVILGISYTIFFNAYLFDKRLEDSIAFSLPSLAIAIFLGIGISKMRKDNNYGVYFAVICLLILVAKI